MTDSSPPRDRDTQADWERIRARLRAELGDASFASWLAPLTLVDVDGEEVTLGVATRFLRDWIESHYADRIATLWADHRPGIQTARIVIHDGLPPDTDGKPHTAGERPQARRDGALGRRVHDERLDSLGSPLNNHLTFREFVVGESNELAHAAAQQVAGVDHLPFNPLYLYGGVGHGKTHLLHAIAWCIRGREPSRRVLYLSAERFMYRFIQAIRQKDTVTFKERLRSADVLLIDDIQFICDKDSTQEEFLHTLNALLDHRCQVVVSADRAPSRLEGMEERLKSRLAGGLAVNILPANYELRLGILREKARPLGIADAPREVLEFLARNITSNARELEMALHSIAAHAALLGGAITLPTTQWVLRDVLVAEGTERSPSRTSSSGSPRTTTSSRRSSPPTGARRPWCGHATSRCTSPSSSRPARCRRSAASSASATTPRSSTRSAASRTCGPRTPPSTKTWSISGEASKNRTADSEYTEECAAKAGAQHSRPDDSPVRRDCACAGALNAYYRNTRSWAQAGVAQGRAQPCQGWGRGFESHRPLQSPARARLSLWRAFSRRAVEEAEMRVPPAAPATHAMNRRT